MKVLSCGPDDDLVMRASSGEDRKAGLHLSDITKRMVFERASKEQKAKLDPNSPMDAMILERGFTWERVLEQALESRQHHHVYKGKEPGYRPPQLCEDGIWMSPDWLEPADPIAQLEEWKCTKKTKRRGFDEVSWSWMPSSMAYLRALLRRGLAHDLTIRFRIWWMNGDYSFEAKTSDFHLLNDYWSVVCQFEKRELEENWRSILSHGRRYGLLKEPPHEEQWQSRKPKTSSPSPARRKPAGTVPATSRGTARIVTFPSTRKLPKHRSA